MNHFEIQDGYPGHHKQHPSIVTVYTVPARALTEILACKNMYILYIFTVTMLSMLDLILKYKQVLTVILAGYL